MNSPKRVDLAGFLHGHPGTDEAGDQTAGQRGERKKGKLEMKGWETQRDRGRTDNRRVEKEESQSRSKQKPQGGQRKFTSCLIYLLFIIISKLIFHEWKSKQQSLSQLSRLLLISHLILFL